MQTKARIKLNAFIFTVRCISPLNVSLSPCSPVHYFRVRAPVYGSGLTDLEYLIIISKNNHHLKPDLKKNCWIFTLK